MTTHRPYRVGDRVRPRPQWRGAVPTGKVCRVVPNGEHAQFLYVSVGDDIRPSNIRPCLSGQVELAEAAQ